MQIPDSSAIIVRFFEALQELKRLKIINKTNFAKKYGINLRNFWQLERDKSRDIMQVAWLSYLVNDFGVSADWLLTGKGEIMKK
jgi:transcriptional regulator with XRE-family HTH domain